ncbi:MAG: 50S ribosomal protein L11 methyltransferase, partial [Rubrivivax sp.]
LLPRAATREEIEDQDWVRRSQSQFPPIHVGGRLWIVPTWHELPAGDAIVVRLDPGLAFGTGSHPSTRLVLQFLEARMKQGERVLDYGCGSGILAVAAALHGARAVQAVDIDPAAVESTRANALANGVCLQAGLPALAQGEHEVVLANILAMPLQLLAPLLCGHVAPGGHLVLAGILERQHEQITQAYAPWIHLAVADLEDGWVLMTGSRPQA